MAKRAKARQKTDEKKVIRVRQEIEWHVASYFLEGFRAMGVLSKDKKFQEMFFAISEYVNDKITPTTDGDITDTFVIVEQEATDEDERKYKEWVEKNIKWFE